MRRKFLLLVLAVSILGLGLSAYAYCSEFGGLKKVVHTQAITQKRTQLDLVLEQGRFYHAKIMGPGTACLKGEITILSDTGATSSFLKHVSFEGCLWAAKVDQIDLGWFRMEGERSRCTVLLELATPPESSEIYLRVETPSFTPWVSNDVLIQIAVCINFLTIVLLAIDSVQPAYALKPNVLRKSMGSYNFYFSISLNSLAKSLGSILKPLPASVKTVSLALFLSSNLFLKASIMM